MKLSLLFFFVLSFGLLASCTSTSHQVGSKTLDPFAGTRGCFLLFNMKTDRFETVIGGEACKERFVPCSSFKVPLALMAFDSGVLKDESQVLKWDGKKGFLESHNQNHNAKTWMRDSVVWFSQRLTPKLGIKRILKYLKDFHYGNEDFSAGITEAWLVSPGDAAPALKISAYEQTEFMKNLWRGSLPVSKKAIQLTKQITFLEKSPKGFNLSGKTGSNFYDHNTDAKQRRGLGWFISHLEGSGQEYIAVTVFGDLTPTDTTLFGGRRAKQITKDILQSKGLW